MLPSYFEFHNPVKILSGHQALENIPYELSLMKSKRPLLITDQGVQKAGLIDVFLGAAKSSALESVSIFSDVPPDSSNRVVNTIAEDFRENRCDSIIAVGGGSPIDTAKGVNILVSHEANDLMAFEGVDRLENPLMPLTVVPTTAGTGSEATLVAVIYNEEQKVKMEFTSNYLVPDLAVLDPRMTLTMPPRVTAATGMDALSHAVEAYTCLQKNPASDAYAFAAIKLIREHLTAAVIKGKDEKARLGMATAALMAGIAFSNSMVGAVHALGHAAGAAAGIHHGTAMSIFLPHCLEFNMEKISDFAAELLLPLAGPEVYAATPERSRPEKFVAEIRQLKEELNILCGLPRTLFEAGVEEHMFDRIAKGALDDGAMLLNPVDMTHADAMAVLKKALR